MHDPRMDRTDLRILAHLQADASASHADLAEAVHLSPSQCSRRIARLRETGVIRGQVALLDEAALGLGVEAYVTVTMASYAREVVGGFHERIAGLPAVVDCCALTGDADYLLRIVAVDLAAFTRLLNDEILGHGDVASLRSSIVLDRIKRTTALPLPAPHG
jgi:Lrp/AsnC family leucine-responsive transcriptional regulator